MNRSSGTTSVAKKHKNGAATDSEMGGDFHCQACMETECRVYVVGFFPKVTTSC